MRKLYLATLLIFLVLIISYACANSFQNYKAPERQETGENKFEYVDSPVYEGSDAGTFDPELGSVEAAVVKFLSSKNRQDEVWKAALVPEKEWTDRLNRKLEDWENWEILKWQLRRVEFINENRAFLTVYFEIDVEGDTHEGEDEFELVKKNEVWLILYPPT